MHPLPLTPTRDGERDVSDGIALGVRASGLSSRVPVRVEHGSRATILGTSSDDRQVPLMLGKGPRAVKAAGRRPSGGVAPDAGHRRPRSRQSPGSPCRQTVSPSSPVITPSPRSAVSRRSLSARRPEKGACPSLRATDDWPRVGLPCHHAPARRHARAEERGDRWCRIRRTGTGAPQPTSDDGVPERGRPRRAGWPSASPSPRDSSWARAPSRSGTGASRRASRPRRRGATRIAATSRSRGRTSDSKRSTGSDRLPTVDGGRAGARAASARVGRPRRSPRLAER
jgi:hypothetical protein